MKAYIYKLSVIILIPALFCRSLQAQEIQAGGRDSVSADTGIGHRDSLSAGSGGAVIRSAGDTTETFRGNFKRSLKNVGDQVNDAVIKLNGQIVVAAKTFDRTARSAWAKPVAPAAPSQGTQPAAPAMPPAPPAPGQNIQMSGFNSDPALTSEKSKKIIKSYTVTSKDKLSLDNSYGEVRVNTWDKNEIRVEVTVLVKANSDEKAQDILDNISIKELRTNEEISLKTSIGDISNIRSWFKHDSHSYQIDYLVSMPRVNPLDVRDSYGKIYLPDLDGEVHIRSAYGGVNAGKLKNNENDVSIEYGRGDINELGNANLRIAYSNLVIQKADQIKISHQYGDLNIEHLNKINGDIQYSKVRIGDVAESIKLNLQYSGDYNFGRIRKTVSLIDLNAQYSSGTLNFDEDLDLNFNVKVEYSAFNYPKDRTSFTKIPDDQPGRTTKEYAGRIGKGNPSGKMIVNSQYGDIRIH